MTHNDVHSLQTIHDMFSNDLLDEWTIDYKDLDDVPYDIDSDDKIITLNNFGLKDHSLWSSAYFRPQIELNMIEAMRMARHMEWIDDTLYRYKPETIILIGRLCEADIQTHKIYAAWMAKETHNNDRLWKYILSHDTSDMADVFAKYIRGDHPVSLALSATLNQWFCDTGRLWQCDHDTLNMIDDFVQNDRTFGDKYMSHALVSGITHLCSTGASYANKSYQSDLIKNPYYADIVDPINAKHLNQIKTDLNTTQIGSVLFQNAQLAARFAICDDD